jgi:hypothetical protein
MSKGWSNGDLSAALTQQAVEVEFKQEREPSRALSAVMEISTVYLHRCAVAEATLYFSLDTVRSRGMMRDSSLLWPS